VRNLARDRNLDKLRRGSSRAKAEFCGPACPAPRPITPTKPIESRSGNWVVAARTRGDELGAQQKPPRRTRRGRLQAVRWMDRRLIQARQRRRAETLANRCARWLGRPGLGNFQSHPTPKLAASLSELVGRGDTIGINRRRDQANPQRQEGKSRDQQHDRDWALCKSSAHLRLRLVRVRLKFKRDRPTAPTRPLPR
jgi:hypothetical protein